MNFKAKVAYQGKDVVVNYDRRRFGNIKGYLLNKLELCLIDRALKAAKIEPRGDILDVPCGTGRLSIHLAKKGYAIKGVDISGEMILYAKEKVARLGLEKEIDLEKGDAEFLNYPDNSFQACVSLRLFGHVPPENRIKILKELRRVVKKSLILTYYHKKSLQCCFRDPQRKKQQVNWYPCTHKEIDQELREVGLKKIGFFHLLRGISETVVVAAEK